MNCDKKSKKLVIITGGVISSVGKGVAAAVLGRLLKLYGFKTCIRKFDPYLNKNPGGLSPMQHGEVYVTDDGMETDMDLGHYERIGDVQVSRCDYTTMGHVVDHLLKQEAIGAFGGRTIQVVPHVTNIIKQRFIEHVEDDVDVVICEIGGTVGDIEILPFLEAARQIAQVMDVVFVHVAHLVYSGCVRQMKTKPIQHSVKLLQEHGIRPTVLCCRSEEVVPDEILEKVSEMCGVARTAVIPLVDAKDNLYSLLGQYHDVQLGDVVCDALKLQKNLAAEEEVSKEVRLFSTCLGLTKSKGYISIVTKYCDAEAHISLRESLLHASAAARVDLEIRLLDAEQLSCGDPVALEQLHNSAGIIVPGGFGVRGTQGKLKAIQHARENNIPFLGICFGMQLAVIESLRAAGFKADSAELDPESQHQAICLIDKWTDQTGQSRVGIAKAGGGTMRLGVYKCKLKNNTCAATCYGITEVHRRHRHRYEVNPDFMEQLRVAGVCVAGTSDPDGLAEVIERTGRFFVGVQYHPEFSSKLREPEPIILGFVKAVTQAL